MPNGGRRVEHRKMISSKLRQKAEVMEEKKQNRRPLPRPNETEEEAVIRRFHDAQRMARFRARRKKALEESRAFREDQLTKLGLITELKKRNILFQVLSTVKPSIPDNFLPQDDETDTVTIFPLNSDSKYSQLLSVIQEIGKDIKLTYAGSRNSMEKLKNEILHARHLVKDCLLETEAKYSPGYEFS
ncbi:uncharacterized protein LOC122508988 [Leptopilina heterotoma]|uniref:uncharacterized protein LOC122508988 n=1 Tax=Leptopilina heterotoma TaxID=63436 RepID=UPI001CA957C6|nr:uncharacterized protein LOC122508988 [Leptopilina heterotoma]XP_043478632.1 uncharacterized protein LOC122508988 [Leptopilina heterotoma]